MREIYDVVVVGAGPAGAAAALSACRQRPGSRVLLLDRADFPRDKSCGDGIAPHAVDVLRALGAASVVTGFRPVLRLRVSAPSGVSAGATLPRPDWVVPRRVFDARLVAQACRAGARLARHRVRHVAVDDRGAVVDGEIRARTLIAADGANSVVRRALGLPRNPPEHLAVAIRGYAPARGREQAIVMCGEDWPSYAWRFPIGDGTANVGYGVLRSRFDQGRSTLIDRMEQALGGTGVDPGTLLGHPLPLSAHRPPAAVGRVLLAGDAASLVNPLSGEGIYYALASGALAGSAAAADPATAPVRYRADAARLLRRHFRHTGLLGRAIRWRPLAEAGVTAAARSHHAFDDLCELTLGRGVVTPRLAGGVVRSLLDGGVSGTPGRPG